MTLETWIYFEPSEKEKLTQIMENNNEFAANLEIQKEFGLSLSEAAEVVKTYNKRIRK